MTEGGAPQPNVRDAAVLLLSLGEQAAADVLKHLGPKDIQRLTGNREERVRAKASRNGAGLRHRHV